MPKPRTGRQSWRKVQGWNRRPETQGWKPTKLKYRPRKFKASKEENPEANEGPAALLACPLVAREVPRAVFSVALVVQRGGVTSAAHLLHQRLGLKMYFKAARIVEVQGRDNLAVGHAPGAALAAHAPAWR